MAIEVLPESAGNVLGVRARGKLTALDYEELWIPKILTLIEAHGTVRLLLHLGEDFEGWELGAAWDDAKFGFRHQDKCEKIAVVGGSSWIERGTRLFAHVLKGEVRTFPAEELAAAWEWIKA